MIYFYNKARQAGLCTDKATATAKSSLDEYFMRRVIEPEMQLSELVIGFCLVNL